jgi:hypothetical protein
MVGTAKELSKQRAALWPGRARPYISAQMTARFSSLGWAVRGEAIDFSYRCDRYGAFVETITFPGRAADLAQLGAPQARLLDLTAAAIGVSYYKANAGGFIAVESGLPTPQARALIEALYGEGLGEFYVRNNLPYPPALTIDAAITGEAAPPAPARPAKSAVVAFGGGKDSHVALALVERAGVKTELVSVALSDKIAQVIADCTDREVYFIGRKLDPRLIAANKAGALNGHIPVTAIHSLILTLYASLAGADWVVLANEHSADEATRVVNGQPVNHQFSKTFRAEALIRDAVKSILPEGPDYFSALRPVHELWIARELAKLPRALARFRSCNRNFVFSDKDRALASGRWCGNCAKCVFTAAITAPFLPRAQSIALLGSDVLDNPANQVFVEELAGFTESKPWECVGTIGEVSATFSHLLDDPEWSSARLVRDIGACVRDRASVATLAAAFEAALNDRGENFLPPQLSFITAREPA